MPRSYKKDTLRGEYSFVDIIPIDVSVNDYTMAGPNETSFRGFSVGTAGDVEITTLTGQKRIIPANCLAVGVFHPIAGKTIHNATTGNTTASEICLGV